MNKPKFWNWFSCGIGAILTIVFGIPSYFKIPDNVSNIERLKLLMMVFLVLLTIWIISSLIKYVMDLNKYIKFLENENDKIKVQINKKEKEVKQNKITKSLNKYLESIEILLNNYNKENLLNYKLNYQNFKIHSSDRKKVLTLVKEIDEVMEKRNPYAHGDIEKMKEICNYAMDDLVNELNKSTKN